MNLAAEDEKYLLSRIRDGETMLVLGAGASVTSKNACGDPLKASAALSKVLAEEAGLPYKNETLVEVLGAVRGDILSDVAILKVYSEQYKNCTPSSELSQLFSYCWRRIYTWNIDDTVENVNRQTVQSRKFFNGMVDKAVEFEGFNIVHVVHLHGEIAKPEHGFIFTEREYASHVKSDRHFWYQRAAQDYLATCPVFIGSSLAEPILNAEIERAKRDGNLVAGRAFTITPDDLTAIQLKSFRARGIIHIRGTLEDFTRWLKEKLPAGWSPGDVVSQQNVGIVGDVKGISFDEVDAAHSLKPVKLSTLKAKLASYSDVEKGTFARYFLQGFPPTWEVAASDIPVKLEGYDSLYKAFEKAIKDNDKLFVVTGQAGSGKTTGLMATILGYAENNALNIYSLRPDIRAVRKAISLLKKIRKRKVILYIGDLFIFGDTFVAELDFFSGEELIIVTTARTSEWREHLGRYLREKASTFQFQRFVRGDFDPLIDRLIRYVPAPRFRALSRDKQYIRLAESQNQLLIALREATQSENFDRIISQEYATLPDDDTKRLFVIAGLATLARVGIGTGAAKEAYGYVAAERQFEKALDALGGIVSENSDSRLFGRHDLYVRHLFERDIAISELRLCIKAILRVYRKYNIPIIRSVGRLDSLLFKAILNHNFVSALARRLKVPLDAADIYEDFEVDFQLDGHFWLQYGLFLAGAGDTNGALEKLTRSIEAYPENAFAVHALADIQLRAAKKATNFDQRARDLVETAVRTLNNQDAQFGLELDVYPIVTLANGHISALVAHNQMSDAREIASAYFQRIQVAQRRGSASALQQTNDKLMKFVTLGEWSEKAVTFSGKRGRSPSSGRTRDKRPKGNP